MSSWQRWIGMAFALCLMAPATWASEFDEPSEMAGVPAEVTESVAEAAAEGVSRAAAEAGAEQAPTAAATTDALETAMDEIADAVASETVENAATEAVDDATAAVAEAVDEFPAAADESAEAFTETSETLPSAFEDATGGMPEATAEGVASSQVPASPAPAGASSSVGATSAQLGPVGYDSEGRPGRIHVVVAGDTLWDISDAYLGTPWVWPSIWTANQDIENPHLILPKDRIWITPTEMRRVTEDEAAALLAGTPASSDPGDSTPAAFDDGNGTGLDDTAMRRTYRYTELHTTGFVSLDAYTGAATIIESEVPRVMLGDHDSVVIGFGQGEVGPGDEFEIFRPAEQVIDPASGEIYGYATEVLGWLRVDTVHEETATGTIQLSRAVIERGDYLLPRPARTPDITVGKTPQVDGLVIHTPEIRRQMGTTDVVYLNRGTAHGLEIGSPLEIFKRLGGGTGFDEMRGDERALPDKIVAKLLVVDATPETAVAVITHTRGEVNRGDRFRGSDSLR